MLELKDGDTEKVTPTTPAVGEEGNKPTEGINLEVELKKTQERLDETIKKMEEKNNQAAQLTEEVRRLRMINKEPLLKHQEAPAPKPNDGFEADDFDSKYEQRRSEEKKQEYISRVNRCFDRFLKDREFDGETDIKFRKLANRTHLGESDEEVMENFQIIYNGISPKSDKKSDDDKIIPVGDGGSEEPIKQKSGKTDWMTKKLNRYEVMAAANFDGGEVAWRKKKQELSKTEV
jgi:hypothetical protein